MRPLQGKKILFQDSFWVYAAVLLLTVPARWLLAALLSAMFHECCHALAIRCFGRSVLQVEIGITGAQIRTEPLELWQALLCLAAGPAGSLGLLWLFRWLPLTALCGCIQGIYNLIPVLPLDGGKILLLLLRYFCPGDRAEKMMTFVKWFVLGLVFLGAMVGFYSGIRGY